MNNLTIPGDSLNNEFGESLLLAIRYNKEQAWTYYFYHVGKLEILAKMFRLSGKVESGDADYLEEVLLTERNRE